MASYAEIIAGRGKTTTEYKNEINKVEQEAENRSAMLAERQKIIDTRKSDVKPFADKKTNELKQIYNDSPLAKIIDTAVETFGKVEDDATGIAYIERGTPKRAGAWSSDLDYWQASWVSDPEKDECITMKYALFGKALNYLSRKPGRVGYNYTLSRYAVLLAQGEHTGDKLSAWHGELPTIELGGFSAGHRSKKFGKTIGKIINNQDISELCNQHRLYLPNPVVVQATPVQFNKPDLGEEINQGLAQFAEQHFVPITEQMK